MEAFSRNELFWGKDNQEKLSQFNIVILGLGGVGSYALEALARSGIEHFTLVDFDKVSESNINRQLIATKKTIGISKVQASKERILEINPNIEVDIINDFYTEDMNKIFEKKFDFVIDAIDTFNFKINLIEYCYKNNIYIISSAGAASRICPEKLFIADISDVEKINCPFATRVIKRLKQDGITKNLPMVLSNEKPKASEKILMEEKITTLSNKEIEFKKITPPTTPFVASTAGIFMASYVVRKLLNL